MTIHKALALASLALAAPAGAEAPKPAKNLDRLVGSWKGSGTLTMGKDTAKLAFSYACKRTSAAFGVLCSLDITGIPGLAAYSETDLFGYEPNSDTYHWFAVTNAGETHDHAAKAADGKLQFVYTGTQDGKPFKEVVDLEVGDKTLAVRSESFVAGASVAVLQGRGTK